MSTSTLYEMLFKLREQQSNCTVSERAEIQRKIQVVLQMIDKQGK